MSGWRAVNVATITEEDVEEEEVGEDGTVSTISSSSSVPDLRENGVDHHTDDGDRHSFIERQDSLVEKEGEGGAEGSTPSSILQAISFSDDQPFLRGSHTLPSRTSPSRTSPSRFSPTPPSPSSPQSTRRKFTQKRGRRGSGFTMTLSDKFVTELTLYDPGSFTTREGQGEGEEAQTGSLLCLGLFLATDQVTGDHSVYKVSPVSPLAALKLKPQDRLLKLNGLSLVGWSHSLVVEWVKNLSVVAVSRQNEAPCEISLCVEYRRAGRTVRAPWEAPSSRQVLASLAIAKKRAIVKSVRETETSIHYRHTQTCRVRLAGSSPPLPSPGGTQRNSHPHSYDTPRFLASCVLPEGGAGVGVVEGKVTESDAAHFFFHTFDVSPSIEGGGRGGREVVVVETTSPPSCFLLPRTPSHLALMHCPWSAVKGLTQADPRCFTLHPLPDGRGVRIEGVFTGNFVCAGPEGVMMVPREAYDSPLPDSTIFQVVPV